MKKRAAGLSTIGMEDVYRLVNRVQLNKKEVKFAVVHDDAIVVENVLNDLGLEYKLTALRQKTTFKVKPNDNEENEEPVIEVEFFDDEILENGQLF